MGLFDVLKPAKKPTVEEMEQQIALVKKQEEYYQALEKKNIAEKKAKEAKQ